MKVVFPCKGSIVLTKSDVETLEAFYNTKLLTPYVERYIREKEQHLGKRRILFTKQEREETLREVEGLYKIFKEYRLVY